MSKIIDNLIDIFLIGGKLILSYIRDFWNTLALLWKEDHLTPLKEEDDFIWNGGVTNEKGSRIDDTNEDNTLVYDEYSLDNQEIITYDGIMGELQDD
tara:strand:- start:29 stop:319 length:291 start_codon:yes stop_codon:yes gene_type:complete